MKLADAIRTALWSMLANPLRTFLTMLGVVIGVGSVITMMAVGQGAQVRISDEIKSFGTNVLLINPGETMRNGVRLASGAVHTLTEADASAIAALPSVAEAAPCVWGTAQIVWRDRNWNTTVVGTNVQQFAIRQWRLQAGRFFSTAESQDFTKVVVLGATAAKKLFGSNSDQAIGRETRIKDAPFKIVGVLEAKGPLASGQDQDDVAFVPISTARMRLIGNASPVNGQAVAYILVKAASTSGVAGAKRDIEALLRQRHHLPPGHGDDFIVNDPAAAMAAQNASTRTIAILLAAIASVSLVVGGISIMNILLVSVAERTREIGIRMAVGARRSDIRNQFLMESVAICVIGGILGVAAGAATASTIARVAGWPIYLGPDALGLALGFSVGTGMFFGWYPARRAARLLPADALRTA